MTFDESKTGPPSDVIREKRIYATVGARRLSLDVIYPRHRDGWGKRSAWLLFHGGGWRQGSPNRLRRQAVDMVRYVGCVAACPEYRLSSEAPFPAQLHDARAAVRWVKENSAMFGVDPNCVGVAGGSAGGHLAALIGTARAKSDDACRVVGVICWNAVFDLADLARQNLAQPQCRALLKVSFVEAPERYIEASPMYHVHPGAPSFLIQHGTDDALVPYAQAEAFARRLENCNVPVNLVPFAGAGHTFYQRDIWYPAVMEQVIAFARRT